MVYWIWLLIFSPCMLYCLYIIILNLYSYCRESGRPFNAHSTGEQVMEGVDLTGKVAIITGSSSGLGLETARLMVAKGCTIIMANRNETKAEKARQQIIDALSGGDDDDPEKGTIQNIGDRLIIMKIDLGSLQSVRDFAQAFVDKNMPLHYLHCNAGIMALPDYRETKEGIEMQWGVCHLGHWYLAQLLMEAIIIPNKTRIVSLASFGHKMISYNTLNEWFDTALKEKEYMGSLKPDYKPYKAYGSAKASNILWARELDKRHKDQGVIAVSCHPGFINDTNLGNEGGATQFNTELVNFIPFMCCSDCCVAEAKDLAAGVSTPLRCLVMSEEEIIGGDYYVNCMPARLDGKVGPSAQIRGGKDVLAEKMWQLSELMVQEKGFALTL